MTEFFQPTKENLLISNKDNQQDVRLKASHIAWQAATSGKNVLVCMMHEPTEQQLDDLTDEAMRKESQVALLGGHLGLMIALKEELSYYGVICFEAKSEKQSVELIQADGSVLKTSRFVYGGLRNLP